MVRALLLPPVCSHPAAFVRVSSRMQGLRPAFKETHDDEAKDDTVGNFPSLWQPVPALQQAML